MATRKIIVELDEELFDTTALLAEASAETSVRVYVIEAISYANHMRMGLPETKQQIARWWERKHNTVERVTERCEEQLKYEERRRVGAG